MRSTTHYDAKYFDWQKDIGAFGGKANRFKFKDYVKSTDKVLDFGCGGGFLLASLDCTERMGIEINPSARKNAEGMGIRAVAATADVPDAWADIIISNHALEHVENPLESLRSLNAKLKPGGLIVFVAPCDTIKVAFRENDINQHLYSWSPMNLGNLFRHSGYEVIECRPYVHKWVPQYQKFVRLFGWSMFNFASRIYARWENSWSQVRVVARKSPSLLSSA